MRRAIILIFTLFAAVNLLFPQEVKVTARFDTTSIFIGDQIFFTVEIEKPVNSRVTFPVFKDTLYDKIEIISGPETDTIRQAGAMSKIILRYLVTSFDSGLYNVPPVIAEQQESGSLKRYYSGYSVLSVDRIRSAPQDTSDAIYDIIKPYRAPHTVVEILQWILIALITAAALYYLIRYLKKRKRVVQGDTGPVIREPAHVIAFRELELLKNRGLWQNGEVKMYYTILTEILREYLENRYNIMSPELTTEETLTKYKTGIKPPKEVYDLLKSILVNADLVKFAKFRPEAGDNEGAFEKALNYISSTMVKDEADMDAAGDISVEKSEEGKL